MFSHVCIEIILGYHKFCVTFLSFSSKVELKPCLFMSFESSAEKFGSSPLHVRFQQITH
jgi:hypothetical protein